VVSVPKLLPEIPVESTETVEEEGKSYLDIIEAASPQFNLNDALPELVKEPVLDLDEGNVSTKI
jgi:hypothetical protein